MSFSPPQVSQGRPRRVYVPCLIIFFLALGVRLLTWQDNRREVGRVQSQVTSDYKDSASQLLRGDLRAFVSDLNHMEHPPGYPILLAGIFSVFGDSDAAIEFVQMIGDSAAAVIVFLIAIELLPAGVAIIAGVLAALSPQFAYYSVLLLPDSLAVVPVLLALYLIIRARRHPSHKANTPALHPRLLNFFVAGALVGLSCWLRANALLLAPFLAAITPVVAERGSRLRSSAGIIFGALLVIAPVTIKNAIVFHHFIPLSLGAGQTLLEGIAEYDEQGRFNVPNTDLGLMKQEADWYGRADYALLLFGADGIKRDRMRIARGLGVIRSHPLWFSGVMLRRATSAARLDRVPLVTPESPVSHGYDKTDRLQPVWAQTPTELVRAGVASPKATLTILNDGNPQPGSPPGVVRQWLRIAGDETKYGDQLVSGAIAVERNKDYLFHVPVKLEEGRALLKVTNENQGKVLIATGIDLVEGVSPAEQPINNLALPFVSRNNTQVRLSFANNASGQVPPVLQVGQIELYELGSSSCQWLCYLRLPIGFVQQFFLTAWILPLVIIGMVLLIRGRQNQTLVILLIVPVYYLLVQSALHTERRYVFVIQYFFLILASVSLWWFYGLLKQIVGLILSRTRRISGIVLV